MGASCLTGIITCQIKKENPTKTLSEFRLDSHVVRPRQFTGWRLYYETATIVVCAICAGRSSLPGAGRSARKKLAKHFHGRSQNS